MVCYADVIFKQRAFTIPSLLWNILRMLPLVVVGFFGRGWVDVTAGLSSCKIAAVGKGSKNRKPLGRVYL